MFSNINNLKIVKVAQYRATRVIEINDRADHLISVRLEGESVYCYGDERIVSRKGDIFFWSKGTSYVTVPNLRLHGMYGIIRFDADIDYNGYVRLEADNYHAFVSAFNDLRRAWMQADGSHQLLAYSSVYRILSMLSVREDREYVSPDAASVVAPALTYLDEHLFDSSLRVSTLYELSGVSSVYFRQIFSRYMGMGPSKYITQKRLECAKNMLDDASCEYVYEAAAAVGYTDPLYFSRIFKRCYGISPTDVLERAKRENLLDG